MSGYPYGNPGGGYPPQYGGGNPSYPQDTGYQPPPPMPNYNDNQSCASLYGTPGPMPNNNNYPPGPYDSYGGNQMQNAPYGMGGGSNFPPPQQYGGQAPQPMYNQPPQQFGGNKWRKLKSITYISFQDMEIHNLMHLILNNLRHHQDQVECIQTFKDLQVMVYVFVFSILWKISFCFRLLQGGPPGPSSQQPGFYPQDQQSIMLASLEQYQGTVFPAANFNPEADCQALSHAMRGAGKSNILLI
jgi:hypothetical protein